MENRTMIEINKTGLAEMNVCLRTGIFAKFKADAKIISVRQP
jgi:hypothetical protein